ncbi:uncharacterized protein B0I36DRAFT_90376 [Microdochium trichocladiopsis]|uniref:Uncharacterized protein n=1 Tax=Microdochium trichocladiopsis TaxID=1682393 RepID=A0A9P9BWN7_9PEZI|nr:uncharacterized protein B0I36DRAFT_90376 [Microdochium trichocladiopsis]KAH7035266.1 hypothetical protein B0I36DRAFT_90376 [Microdochium trichocladiopsis]
MSILGKIKLGKSQSKEKKEQEAQKAKDEAQKPKYVHVPSHAAADAMTGAPPCWAAEDRPRILAANQQRISRDASRLSLPSIPRVQSSLSYVTYPASEASPVVALQKNYSYSSMPGTSAWASRAPSLVESRHRARYPGSSGQDVVPPMPRRKHNRTLSGPSSLYGRGTSANTSVASVESGLEMWSRKQAPVLLPATRGISDLSASGASQSRPTMARRSTTDTRSTTRSARRVSPLNPAALMAKSVEPPLATGSSQATTSNSSFTSESPSERSEEAIDSTAPSSIARTPDLATTRKEYEPPTGTKLAEALSDEKTALEESAPRHTRAAFWKNKKHSADASRGRDETSPKDVSVSRKPEIATASKHAMSAKDTEVTELPTKEYKAANGAKKSNAREQRNAEGKKKRWAWFNKDTAVVSA